MCREGSVDCGDVGGVGALDEKICNPVLKSARLKSPFHWVILLQEGEEIDVNRGGTGVKFTEGSLALLRDREGSGEISRRSCLVRKARKSAAQQFGVGRVFGSHVVDDSGETEL